MIRATELARLRRRPLPGFALGKSGLIVDTGLAAGGEEGLQEEGGLFGEGAGSDFDLMI